MKKKLLRVLSGVISAVILLTSLNVVLAENAELAYPEITALQNEEGTFVSMNGNLICELEGNRYLRFRATDADDNWIGADTEGIDLCVDPYESNVKGIVIETADFVNYAEEGWFKIDVSGYKDGLDCFVDFTIKGIWDSAKGKFKYNYTTAMDANLELWYQNSATAMNTYNHNPNNPARIEITDYFIEGISYPILYRSENYSDMPIKYEWFVEAKDGINWQKFPKIHTPQPTRKGNYVTITDESGLSYEGGKYGFIDSERGGWISTIKNTSSGILYSICWYYWDVHIFAMEAVPPRYSAERFKLDFSLDYEPVSADEGKKIVDGATERNWRDMEEYQLPLFTRYNTFDTLICDDVIPSDKTAGNNIWWASSYDCYRDDTVGYDDNYSVTIKRDGNPTKSDAWNTFMWGPEVEAGRKQIKNHRYRLSAMVKTENCTGDIRIGYAIRPKGGDFFYGTNTHNSDGTPITDGTILWYYTEPLTGTNDWTELSLEFVVQNQRNSILLEQNGSGQCWFDNVVLEDLGEVTADDYYIYEDYENDAGGWVIANSNTDASITDGAYVISPITVGSTNAQANHSATAHSGRWVAEFEASATCKFGTLMAGLGSFNLEVQNNSNIVIKTSKEDGTSVNTKFKTDYVAGTPLKCKAVMDFDTKAFEFYCNGERINLGEANYIRQQNVATLQSFTALVNPTYSGNITIDNFMVYADSDKGSVNISLADLKIENKEYNENIVLPVSGLNGAEITWSSSDETIVANDGKVFRSDNTGYAVLTATVTKGNASATKKFPVKVAPYAGTTFNLDGISAYSDKTVAKITVADDSDNVYTKPAALLACYKGDSLVGVTIENISLDAEEKPYTLTAYHNSIADSAKVVLWDMETLRPIANNLSMEFSTQIVLELEEPYAEVGEPVAYEIYALHGESKIALSKSDYSIEETDLTIDYDNKTITFLSGGIKNVKITTDSGVYGATVVVNDKNSEVYVKGAAEFESDFEASDAINTYLKEGKTGYSIKENAQNEKMLATAPSSALDSLAFGPSLSDYAVEMEFMPTKFSGSGENYIAIGMRADQSSNINAYRIGVFERRQIDSTNMLYNRLGIARGNVPFPAGWHYADYSDTELKNGVELNKTYKLSASIFGDKITGTLYDVDGNVIESISDTISNIDSNAQKTTLASGQTILCFQCLAADISSIKIYDFEKSGEIRIVPSNEEVSVGDTIQLSAYSGETKLDAGMVKYSAEYGLEIDGASAVVTSEGRHTIIAEYTDFAGNTKYTAINITAK